MTETCNVDGHTFVFVPDSVVTLEGVKGVVLANFPRAWLPLEAALATVAQLLLKDQSACAALTFQGAPASEKTTILSFLYGNSLVHHVDGFTPKAFVSHMSSVKEEELQELDLLPKIKDKVLIVPELAPLFSKPGEALEETLGTLVRVFDGQGLVTSSGARGTRGYEGDYRFAWLAATTPITHVVWRALARLGSRWLFYNMPSSVLSDEELIGGVTAPRSYRERVEECRQVVRLFLNQLFKKLGGVRAVEWQRAESKQLRIIARLARLLAHCRGDVGISSYKTSEGEVAFSFTLPLIEQPPRLVSLLYDLARGRALLYGRTQIDDSDLSLVAYVALSSMPFDRAVLLHSLIEKEGRLTLKEIETVTSTSKSTASRLAEMFLALGVVTKVEWGDVGPQGGRPNLSIELKPEFYWLLEPEFRGLLSPPARTLESVKKTSEESLFQESQGTRGPEEGLFQEKEGTRSELTLVKQAVANALSYETEPKSESALVSPVVLVGLDPGLIANALAELSKQGIVAENPRGYWSLVRKNGVLGDTNETTEVERNGN